MIKCSVCINTYKRPFLLKKLLDSLNNQHLDENTDIEIIVADNSHDKEGEKVIEEFLKYSKLSIRYCFQPIKNISLTRNLAVKNAGGDYILFIDDDGYADEFWIKNMLTCALNYAADAVFGRVIPYFDEDTPIWLLKGRFFERGCPETGKIPNFMRTGNCLIKADILKSISGPFDPQYGLTGGEDTHLFETLFKKNLKFVSCYEGIVYDYVHPNRANFKWLFQRSLRTGNSFTRRRLEFSDKVFKEKSKYFLKAVSYSIISSVFITIYIFSKKFRVYWTLKLAGNIGHLMAIFNYKYKEYE